MNAVASPSDPLELLTLRQVSALLKRSRRQLYDDIQAGRIKVVRLGRNVRVPRAEVERIMREGL